ncbi:META domain-containing protein [Sphingobacterium sp. SGG-5]|uniref:META domain-containing protein n=1 Tax=Sphingobacterium sp. SGG-5 TaxID=2710881 RepID=UPI0013EDB729|nr:META domain-containing protein [Sphingobacterium sp. SGG-5]NGM62286.1 META domain-containing protein [Sphingobacterium sp. SGG-5]
MKFNIILIAAVLFCIVNSCGLRKQESTAQVENSTDIYQGKWKLIELNGSPVADKVNGKEPFLVFDKTTKRYSASGGCNGLGGNFELKANQQITFSQGMSTMMACQDMTIERGFGQLFAQADNYTLAGDILSLKKGKETLAKFKTMPQQNANLEGTWQLDYLGDPGENFEELYANKKPTITFNLTEKKISGNSSCNNYFSTFNTEGSTIRFGEIGSTRMFCPGNGEAVFFENLKKVNAFSVQGDQLHFIMGDIAIMRFKKI